MIADVHLLRDLTGRLSGWLPAERHLRPLPGLLHTLETQVTLVRGAAQERWPGGSKERNDDPYATPPLTGPEELLNPMQYATGQRSAFVRALERLEGSVLTRRMSAGEEAAFRTAAATRDVDTALTALFPGRGGRGEAAFAVDVAFIFSREVLDLKASGWTTVHAEPGYERIAEIPITAGMLAFLRDHAYVSNPSEGAKFAAFNGSPNLKFEGGAGGARDSASAPNVIIKKQGFAQFWAAADSIRFFDALGYSGMKRAIARERALAGADGPAPDTSAEAQARHDARHAPRVQVDPFEGGLGLFD